MRLPSKPPAAGTSARSSLCADDNTRRFSNKSLLYRCKSAGPMGGPLWEATLPLAESYTHTNPMSATRAAAGPATDSPWLAAKTCIPCRGGVPPLNGEELAALQTQVTGWNVIEDHHITKMFKFPDFREALKFVNRVGEFAEEQGHHPDIFPSLGKSRDYDLDAQNQRPDGERFCPGRQNRPALQILVFSSQRPKLPRRRPPRSICFDLADFRVAAARFAPKNFFDSP